jgi:hypothetical protein
MLHSQYRTLNLRELLPENSLRLTWIFAIGMRDGLDGAMKGIEIRLGEIKLAKKLEDYFKQQL